MPAEISQLQFRGYKVTELHFEPKKMQIENTTIHYSPMFERNIRKVKDNEHLLQLTVVVGTEDDMPFLARVGIEGVFVFEDIENQLEMMKTNATAILFPYLRASLTQLTVLANIPPLVIPTYNIIEMFKSIENEKDVEKATKKHRKKNNN